VSLTGDARAHAPSSGSDPEPDSWRGTGTVLTGLCQLIVCLTEPPMHRDCVSVEAMSAIAAENRSRLYPLRAHRTCLCLAHGRLLLQTQERSSACCWSYPATGVAALARGVGEAVRVGIYARRRSGPAREPPNDTYFGTGAAPDDSSTQSSVLGSPATRTRDDPATVNALAYAAHPIGST
jgi:hypothetical protein